MPFVVVYDASVLYPSTLRDLLIRLAQTGLIHARFTEQIMDEMFAALQRDRRQLDPVKLGRTRTLMGMAVRDWKVTGHEPLIDSLKLPDPDDRHVLAAGNPGRCASDRDVEPARLPNHRCAAVGYPSEVAGRVDTRSDQP